MVIAGFNLHEGWAIPVLTTVYLVPRTAPSTKQKLNKYLVKRKAKENGSQPQTQHKLPDTSKNR